MNRRRVAFATTSVSRTSIAVAIVDPSIALDTRFGRSGCLGDGGAEGGAELRVSSCAPGTSSDSETDGW